MVHVDATLLLNMLDDKWKIKELSNNILIYGSLMYYKNINDEECIELKRIAEILLNRYLYKNANSEEKKIFYLSKEIENYVSSVFKQTMYTEFENDLYEIKTKCELISDILCQRYNSIIKKYYGDNIVCDEIAGVEWARLGHLYRWSYYPYKYATGLLMASIVVDSLIDKKTLSKEEYIKFLSVGSSQYSLDLLKILNIDLINTDIIEASFNVMIQDIEKLHKVLSLDLK